ncbi:MAG TPA: DUF397 domain-containing protein [Acidimicrobiales bacterium]|jgi:hypothetical protein|nr:DUF397 domain-containing protein [Acidimicrobiales bacterium]
MTSESAPEPRWVKSSFSFGAGECLELALFPDGIIGVRDSKDRAGAVLRFTRGEMDAFVRGVVAGEFDHLR